MMDSDNRAGWARAKFLLERAFETCSSPVAYSADRDRWFRGL